jgi:hypothetical protein
VDSTLNNFCKSYVTPTEGKALIVGSSLKPGRDDRRKLYDEAIGLDMEESKGVDLVHDLTSPLPENLRGAFAHAECTSVLEHCRKPWLLAQNLEDALMVGGTILFSVPFVWREHAYPHDYFRFTADGVRELFPRIDWKTLIYIGALESPSANKALRSTKAGTHPYFARTEVYGFGVRV